MSQQYTEVEWQDPAGGNPGTLINKARLDQMQTAHHFADGLEETDTVPTADPGVAYHKIVYCTADNTLYRWDGEAWTADIDDPTRELLEEHLADHDNPHQVTKAQVGLGNCDNTSDADKPISTATQTALNAKADKSDTYTKTQVDTALALKADKATTYTKTETDTLLGAKADKATTLAGYGITDAYTKTEADTLLGAKANDNAVVKLTGTQRIQGEKDFDSSYLAEKDNGVAVYSEVPASHRQNLVLKAIDKNGDWFVRLEHWAYSGGSSALSHTARKEIGGVAKTNELRQVITDDGTAYITAPSRTYNSAYTTDVATIATLDQYTPMVRTTGNQTVAGVKTFTSAPIISHDDDNLNLQNPDFTIGTKPSSTKWATLNYTDSANTRHGMIALGTSSVGNSELRFRVYNFDHSANALMGLFATVGGDAYLTAPTRAYNASNTNDVATIGTLDAYTPMVRTTGNQSIDGIKNFSTPTLSKFKGLSLTDGWFKVIEFTVSGSPLTSAVFVADRNHNQFGILVMVTQSSGNWSINQIAGNLDPANFRLARKADRTKGYLFHNGGRISTNLIFANYAWMNESMCSTADYIVPTDTNAYAEPTVGDDWQSVETWS